MTTATKVDPIIDLSTRVMVKIPNKSGRDKSWARIVDGISSNATTGNDWSGDWLERGSTVDLPIGTLIVDYDMNADKKGRRDKDDHNTALRVVMPHGVAQVIDSSTAKAWAQELRSAGRKWLAMEVRDRVLAACRSYLEQYPSDLPDKPITNEGRRLRAEWISLLSSKPGAPEGGKRKAAAIAKIKEQMVKYGITLDDLRAEVQ